MTWGSEQPYDELPALEVEARAVLMGCIKARTALAELNQAVLINTLPLLEAKDSSEIENIVTTTDKLFQFNDGDDSHVDAATKEAVRYRTTLHEEWEALSQRPINCVRICEAVIKEWRALSGKLNYKNFLVGTSMC